MSVSLTNASHPFVGTHKRRRLGKGSWRQWWPTSLLSIWIIEDGRRANGGEKMTTTISIPSPSIGRTYSVSCFPRCRAGRTIAGAFSSANHARVIFGWQAGREVYMSRLQVGSWAINTVAGRVQNFIVDEMWSKIDVEMSNVDVWRPLSDTFMNDWKVFGAR